MKHLIILTLLALAGCTMQQMYPKDGLIHPKYEIVIFAGSNLPERCVILLDSTTDNKAWKKQQKRDLKRFNLIDARHGILLDTTKAFDRRLRRQHPEWYSESEDSVP